jgi:hypothetical protein
MTTMRTMTKLAAIGTAFLFVTPFLFAGAFGCSSSSTPSEQLTDAAGMPDTNPTTTGDGGGPHPVDAAPTCFTNPMTHFQIINACTDAAFVDKTPVLPLLNPDGSLPPIP